MAIEELPRLQPRAILGAAQRIRINDDAMRQSLRRVRQDWQDEAWDVYDELGEVKYAVNFMANVISKVRLYAAIDVEPDEPPVPIGSDAGLLVAGNTESVALLAEQELARLRAPVGGQAEILRATATNLQVPGECFLIGLNDGTPDEQWQIRSIDEVTIGGSGSKTTLEMEDGSHYDLAEGSDFWGRIWRRHPRKFFRADSALRGVLAQCETLLTGQRLIRATMKSRLPNGLLLIPNEIDFGPTDQTTTDEGEDGPVTTFDEWLMDAMTTPIQDEGAASSVVPLTLRSKSEYLKEIRLVSLGRTIDPHDLEAMDKALRGLAQGLDSPPEIITGMADVNHWSSFVIDMSTFTNHAEPLVQLIADSFTSLFLRPGLEKAGVAPELIAKIRVWYDPQPAITHPNRTQDAKDAHTAYAISDASLRRELSFTDDDAPDDEELQRRIALHASRLDPTIMGELLRDSIAPQIVIPDSSSGTLPAGQAPPAGESPQGTNPAPKSMGPPPITASASSRDVSKLGARLGGIDRDYRAALSVALDNALRRGIERAGARLRARNGPTKAAIANTPNYLVASTLGPALVAATGITEDQMLEGMTAEAQARFESLTRKAQRRLRAEARRMGADPDMLDALEATQDDHRSRAWEWLAAALLSEARGLLFDPHPNASPLGEIDSDVLVSHRLVRSADVLAGGGELDGLEPVSGPQAGGVGTGPDAMDAFAALDIRAFAYEWVWGGSAREFPPHVDLDGYVFDGWEDPALATPPDAEWLGVPFLFVGDHDGCSCSADPLLQEVFEEEAP